ncbi:ADP-ribosylglycohydrolase family protein [Trichormus azollae]|uniref:ADP-ribosylglycohydrolase family protein n=1 Tax=Trichormus azollae TaxID=1164 RepID=UPI00325DD835
MLLELAIGDAYGAGFEYANEMIFANDLSPYIKHPRHQLIPGSYTDDTQMSIGIAESIVSQALWAPEVLAENFFNAFKRDPREGYASRF